MPRSLGNAAPLAVSLALALLLPALAQNDRETLHTASVGC